MEEQRVIVIYESKRGSTKQYAEWIAERLGCDCVPLASCALETLGDYDVVVFGGWLRGSGIVGFDKMKIAMSGIEDRLVLFVTGISDYNAANYQQICEINFKDAGDMSGSQLFFCPGRYDPANVKGLDRFLMALARRVLIAGKTGNAESLAAADHMREIIDHGADLVDERYVNPIVHAVKQKAEAAHA